MDQTPLILNTLRGQQRRLLDAVAALEAMVAGDMPTVFDDLAALRWTFTRDMMLHFSYIQSRVLDPLMSDFRPDVARRAARSSDDLRSVCEQFQRHAVRWKGLPLAENWSHYTQAIALLMRRTRVRVAAQDSDILPSLPVQPGGPRVEPLTSPLDYAREAWKIRLLIYDDQRMKSAA